MGSVAAPAHFCRANAVCKIERVGTLYFQDTTKDDRQTSLENKSLARKATMVVKLISHDLYRPT
jgi:hypothetical protein